MVPDDRRHADLDAARGVGWLDEDHDPDPSSRVRVLALVVVAIIVVLVGAGVVSDRADGSRIGDAAEVIPGFVVGAFLVLVVLFWISAAVRTVVYGARAGRGFVRGSRAAGGDGPFAADRGARTRSGLREAMDSVPLRVIVIAVVVFLAHTSITFVVHAISD